MFINLFKNIILFYLLILSLAFGTDKKFFLPEVTAEYATNTLFAVGILDLHTRTFRVKNKKRIDTFIDNVPQSVIINYEKQTVTYVWPKTFSYLIVKLNPESQKQLKESSKITYLKKMESDFIHGYETDIFKVKMELIDGTVEESTRWITKHGVTLKEKGFIDGKEGKIHFLSEFSNVRIFKQDERLFDVPEGYTVAPIGQLDDINELLKLMVKRT